jgi:hypothetical protein
VREYGETFVGQASDTPVIGPVFVGTGQTDVSDKVTGTLVGPLVRPSVGEMVIRALVGPLVGQRSAKNGLWKRSLDHGRIKRQHAPVVGECSWVYGCERTLATK